MIEIRPVSELDADVRVPGSKSLTNRALVLGALAGGETVLRGALDAEDPRRTAEGLVALGAKVAWEGDVVRVAAREFPARGRRVRLDLGECGTALRFLTAVAALAGGETEIDGAPGLRRRPVGPLAEALRALGADVRTEEGGRPPVRVGPRVPRGGAVSLPAGESSQYASALLLVGPRLAAGLSLALPDGVVSRPYLDLTIAALRDFGADVRERPGGWNVRPGALRGREYEVEGDASAAAFLFAAAAVTGGRVRVRGIPRASRQGDLAFLGILESMGAEVSRQADAITVTGGPLRGVDVDLADTPDLAPVLAATAMVAAGATVIRGVPHLRVKESDRIAAAVAAVRALGGTAEERTDGLTVAGGGVGAGTVDPAGDHRIAMAFALPGLTRPGVRILDPDCADKSWPGYFARLARFGEPAPGGADLTASDAPSG